MAWDHAAQVQEQSCKAARSPGGSAAGVVQGDLGADRTVMAAAATGENSMTLRNLEVSLCQKQGGRSGYVPERQQWPVRSEMVVICGRMDEGSAKNPCISSPYRVE